MNKSDYAQRMYDLLIQSGRSPIAAYAIIGNARHETGDFSKFTGDNGNSGGTFHFNGPRKRGLFDFAKNAGLDPNSPEAGVGYLYKEVQEGKHVPTNLFQMLDAAPSVEAATKLFSDVAERPGVPAIANRVKLAKEVPSIISTSTPVTTQALVQPSIDNSMLPTINNIPDLPIDSTLPPPPQELKVADLFNGDTWKNMTLANLLNLRGQFGKAPGFGDMSHFKAGMAANRNDYQDMSHYAQPALASLMQMVLSGGK